MKKTLIFFSIMVLCQIALSQSNTYMRMPDNHSAKAIEKTPIQVEHLKDNSKFENQLNDIKDLALKISESNKLSEKEKESLDQSYISKILIFGEENIKGEELELFKKILYSTDREKYDNIYPKK